MTHPWTADELKNLRILRAKGMTAKQTGAEINRTESSVGVQIWRLKLPEPKKVGCPTSRQKIVPLVPKKPAPKPRVEGAVFSSPVHLYELRANHCRAVSVDRADDGRALFCGEPTDGGTSWCIAHRRLFLIPPKEYVAWRSQQPHQTSLTPTP